MLRLPGLLPALVVATSSHSRDKATWNPSAQMTRRAATSNADGAAEGASLPSPRLVGCCCSAASGSDAISSTIDGGALLGGSAGPVERASRKVSDSGRSATAGLPLRSSTEESLRARTAAGGSSNSAHPPAEAPVLRS